MPSLRPLLSWEALNPAPYPGTTEFGGRDPRMRLAEMAERGARYMAPQFFAIHPIEAHEPEEDVLVMDLSFFSPTVEASMRVPDYAAWFQSVDQRPAYRYLKRVIQLLLWQRDGRYLGKTPHHLENLPALLEVFPGAKVIVTHRDPAKVVPSFCSMMAHGRRLFSDAVNLLDVGRQFHAKQLKGVTDAMNARRTLPTESFIDVHYADLMADPINEVRRIYDFLGYELLPETVETMNAFRLSNPKNRHGTHRYTPEDFGLTRVQLDRDFTPYREHFGVAQEL